MAVIALRPVEDRDLDALFEQMRDPEAVRMAAFTPPDPDDREAFDVHMAKVRSSPDTILRAVTCDGRLVGSAGSFLADGQTEVTYWIDRAVWGQGIATRAAARRCLCPGAQVAGSGDVLGGGRFPGPGRFWE